MRASSTPVWNLSPLPQHVNTGVDRHPFYVSSNPAHPKHPPPQPHRRPLSDQIQAECVEQLLPTISGRV